MQRLPEYDTYAIEIDQIWSDPEFNCRHAFTPLSVEELAKSIGEDGLKIPIIVQPGEECGAPEPYKFRLIAGFRRFYAVTGFLKWKTVPCQVQFGLSEQDARKINYIENLERQDLNLLEEADGLARLYPNGSAREIAQQIKRPVHWVNDRILLMTMPEQIKSMAGTGSLTAYNIRQISQEQPEQWLEVAQEIQQARSAPRSVKRGKYNTNTLALTKEGIARLIEQMFDAGIDDGIGPRVAARCAGYITDAEIKNDIILEVTRREALRRRNFDVFPNRGTT